MPAVQGVDSLAVAVLCAAFARLAAWRVRVALLVKGG